MIEGLKLTMTGEQLRKRLAERVKQHQRLAEHYKREATREPDPNVEYDCVLPEHMCEYEQEFHGWRAECQAAKRWLLSCRPHPEWARETRPVRSGGYTQSPSRFG